MSSFFLIPGSPEHGARVAELEARERAHDERMAEQVRKVEDFMRLAETDDEASKVLALARLIRWDNMNSYDNALEYRERLRRGPRGNDSRYIEVQTRCGIVSAQYALDMARNVLSLVRSWGETPPAALRSNPESPA